MTTGRAGNGAARYNHHSKERHPMSTYSKEQIARLTEGRLDWDTTLRMLSMPKDKERFLFYLEVLQDRVPWDERIVPPLGPNFTSLRASSITGGSSANAAMNSATGARTGNCTPGSTSATRLRPCARSTPS
jgi:hypothetical protein